MPSLPQIPLSRKVRGVNAVGAPAETHAPLRHAGHGLLQVHLLRAEHLVLITW